MVAVRAADIAFVDLREHRRAVALCGEPGDCLTLVGSVTVVELENQRITLPAIDARMGSKVRIQFLAKRDPIVSCTRPGAGGVLRPIAPIVLAGVQAHALPTPTSSQSSRSILERKLGKRLEFPASGAASKPFV